MIVSGSSLRPLVLLENRATALLSIGAAVELPNGSQYVCEAANVSAGDSAACLGGALRADALTQLLVKGELQLEAGAPTNDEHNGQASGVTLPDYEFPLNGNAEGPLGEGGASSVSSNSSGGGAAVPNPMASGSKGGASTGTPSMPARDSDSDSDSDVDDEDSAAPSTPSKSDSAPQEEADEPTETEEEDPADVGDADESPTPIYPVGWVEHPSVTSQGGWHCSATKNFPIWSTQACLVLRGTTYQAAVIARNRSTTGRPLTVEVTLGESGQSSSCESQTIEGSDYSVCFGEAYTVAPNELSLSVSGSLLEGSSEMQPNEYVMTFSPRGQ